MKVKLLICRGGNGIIQNSGDVIEVSEREGMALIANNAAEPADKFEQAVSKKPSRKAAKVLK